jgi:CheY-like chemotaxis protein
MTTQSSADLLSAKILIVDDQLTNVQLLEQLLNETGYRGVTYTMNPAEVCALHRQNHYDLILLDLQMPRAAAGRRSGGGRPPPADGWILTWFGRCRPGSRW